MRVVQGVVAIFLMVAATPLEADSSFLAQNGLVVEPREGANFHIPYRGKSGASDFWCAAGDYAMRGLDAEPDERIYRTSPPPRRSGEGISFSFSSENAVAPGVTVFFGDGGLTASAARALCEDRLIRTPD